MYRRQVRRAVGKLDLRGNPRQPRHSRWLSARGRREDLQARRRYVIPYDLDPRAGRLWPNVHRRADRGDMAELSGRSAWDAVVGRLWCLYRTHRLPESGERHTGSALWLDHAEWRGAVGADRRADFLRYLGAGRTWQSQFSG